MSSVYFYSFNVRDSSYFVRFVFTDPGVIERIADRKELVNVPDAMLRNPNYDIRAYRNRWSWWKPDEINSADTLYVDRPTSEKMSGDRSRDEPTGFSRVLWISRETRIAYYREIEFQRGKVRVRQAILSSPTWVVAANRHIRSLPVA